MKLKKVLVFVHLWVGLVSGAVLSVVGITGSLYVFQPELTGLFYSQYYQTQNTGPVFPAAQVVQKAEAQFQEPIATLNFPTRELENYQIKLLKKKEWLFYDFHTGEFLGEMKQRRGVFEGILELHRQLTLGETGSLITGTCALLMAIVLLSTGLYLWFPRKKRLLKDGLRYKKGAGPKRRVYDLHNVTGFYASIPLFIMAVTGVNFAFPEETQTAFNQITATTERMPAGKKLKSAYVANAESIDVEQALQRMATYYPNHAKRSLAMPKDSVGTILFTFVEDPTVGAGPELRPMVYLDQYTGKEIYHFNPETSPRGARILRNWFIPIHFGEVGGYVTRVLWFVLGFLPAFLWVSGFVIWRNKKCKNKFATVKAG
ncbi:PepSY-associated TM helix domain-containing protein [Nibribacter ruber]|uniref:PepSY-associated TM helix domain-containing protein n=1 Tax=Nibribacter ruber TaxID=2698458 RepID=UPI001E3CB768|nr:PepSY-associated TM helix domain-containing protein [Nibribacter ruber]